MGADSAGLLGKKDAKKVCLSWLSSLRCWNIKFPGIQSSTRWMWDRIWLVLEVSTSLSLTFPIKSALWTGPTCGYRALLWILQSPGHLTCRGMGSEDPWGSLWSWTGTWCCPCLLRSWMALVEAEWQANGYTLSMLSFNMHSSFSEKKHPDTWTISRRLHTDLVVQLWLRGVQVLRL